MTYTPNVPQANQQISATQGPILANFTYINTAQKVDHAWNDNAIDGQPYGTHQKISLPDLPSDVTVLPAGIKSVMYSIGGNLYSWNGAKRSVSGNSQQGTLDLTATPILVATLPADCIGTISLSTREGTLINQIINYSFFTVAGVGYVSSFTPPAGSTTSVSLLFTGLNLQARVNASPTNDYMTTYKLIYWPI